MKNYLPENSKIDYITMTDGMLLRVGFFPAVGTAKASILLVGGHREFLEKYTEFIIDFQKRGFDIYSYDHRGQGGSGRALENKQKSHNPDFGKIVDDMNEIINRHVKAKEINHPLYLIAHSMGAQFGLRYLHDYPGVIKKAVLLAPFTNFNIGGKIFTWATKLYAQLANFLGFSAFFAPGQARHKDMIDHEYAFLRLTHDRERYDFSQKVLDANPELFIGGVTFGWLKGVIASLKLIQSHGYLTNVSTPILALLAEDEEVVDNAMTIKLIKQVQSATHEVIPNARHEMYREVDEIRDQVINRIDDFLGQ